MPCIFLLHSTGFRVEVDKEKYKSKDEWRIVTPNPKGRKVKASLEEDGTDIA